MRPAHTGLAPSPAAWYNEGQLHRGAGRGESVGKYDTTRYNHNLNRATFDVEGTFGVPRIAPVRGIEPPGTFVDFNWAVGHSERLGEGSGVHFFLDDYRFERLWSNPDAYLPMLTKCGAVLSPDFSTYVDWPMAVQVYNHWRKHWLGAYLQSRGCTVVPTISWGDLTSHRWCFDGEPCGGIVAVGSRGCNADPEVREAFNAGFEAMVERLNPEAVWAFGGRMEVYDRYPGLVVPVEDEYSKRLHSLKDRRRKEKEDGR